MCEKNVVVQALKLVNQYVLAEANLPKECPVEEFHAYRKRQSELVGQLVVLDHPLVQVIATKLQMDRHSANCRCLIRQLADSAR